MKTIDALNVAKSLLEKNNIDTREAKLFLAFALGVSKEELIKYTQIPDEVYTKLLVLLEKRCNGIPYAYIVGHKEFMKLDFEVNSSVLIPRDDTEVLVEKVIEIASNISKNEVKILDLCTGSGCIAISLDKNILNAKVYASDISKKALEVAMRNAKKNDATITFIESDLFEELNDNIKFDIIVSNPPYIRTDVIDTLQKEVKDNEPIIALDGGTDGLSFYERIIKDAKAYLEDSGYLAFEIGYDQAIEVSNLLKENNYKNIKVFKDFSENDRVVIANI
ncbi:MAG: peptide chain release factor N(5)-glutamine methyltransferase [Clostridia bacterium]|nr:peptide chain release factor N(5)-glutamine methyltransferase [Clostridia bacterium]